METEKETTFLWESVRNSFKIWENFQDFVVLAKNKGLWVYNKPVYNKPVLTETYLIENILEAW